MRYSVGTVPAAWGRNGDGPAPCPPSIGGMLPGPGCCGRATAPLPMGSVSILMGGAAACGLAMGGGAPAPWKADGGIGFPCMGD
ncbi:MAG: hypothetical protein ABIJ56_20645 [Pseudomonadota bacterium]